MSPFMTMFVVVVVVVVVFFFCQSMVLVFQTVVRVTKGSNYRGFEVPWVRVTEVSSYRRFELPSRATEGSSY